jgi:hypothetical protein
MDMSAAIFSAPPVDGGNIWDSVCAHTQTHTQIIIKSCQICRSWGNYRGGKDFEPCAMKIIMMLTHLPLQYNSSSFTPGYLALGAHKSTHVFHDPEYRQVDLTAKVYLLPHILQRYLLRSGDKDSPVNTSPTEVLDG